MAVKFYPKKKSLVQIVNELVKIAKRYVRIKTLLLDRGFRNTKILNDLEFLQIPMLMPCIKDEKTRKEFENAKSKFHILKYYWKNAEGEHADFKLMIMKLDNGKEIGFYTTLKYYIKILSNNNIVTMLKKEGAFKIFKFNDNINEWKIPKR